MQSITSDPMISRPDLSSNFFEWLCRLGDNTLILSHRLSQWCGHGPSLEEDIALTNISLDLIGHTQMWLTLAGEVEGKGRNADTLAFLRDAYHFRNILMVELPKGDMAFTLMRQLFFDTFHFHLLNNLTDSASPRTAEIAAKALKEASYHLERSAGLVVRLGDGTRESQQRMQLALAQLWPYTMEMFMEDDVDEAMVTAGIAPPLKSLKTSWESALQCILEEATLTIPDHTSYAHAGGKKGRHTEHLGYLLAEMQFLQRAYPGVSW